jgi:hypothetical protein
MREGVNDRINMKKKRYDYQYPVIPENESPSLPKRRV